MTSRELTRLRLLTVALVCAFIAFSFVASGENSREVLGLWSGTLVVGDNIPLRLVLHVTADPANRLDVSIDSIDEGEMGVFGGDVALSGSRFSFAIPPVAGRYQAVLAPDGNSLTGNWIQAASSMPLVFTRTTAADAPTPAPHSTPLPARPPIRLRDLGAILDQEFKPVLADGLLSKPTHGGLVLGVVEHGERRIFSYGTARPDSVFEIGQLPRLSPRLSWPR